MIEIFIYNKETGILEYADTGLADYVINDMGEGSDFTLVRPPSLYTPHKWNGKEWEAVDADNQSI